MKKDLETDTNLYLYGFSENSTKEASKWKGIDRIPFPYKLGGNGIHLAVQR